MNCPAKAKLIILLLFSIILISGSSAHAFNRKVDITPFIGFRAGGSFEHDLTGSSLRLDDAGSYGLAIDVDYDSRSQFQLLWSRQETEFKLNNVDLDKLELNVDYYHFGGTYCWLEDEKFKPYVIASLGGTYFQPTDSAYYDELRFSMGIGIGMKYFFTPHIGLMAEGRGYGTFMGGSGSIFCSGGCTIYTQQTLFLQFEGRTGLVIRF